MSFTTTFNKSKCIKCLSDKFVSKSKLHVQYQNGKYSQTLLLNNKKPNHKYPIIFSYLNYSIKKYTLKSTKYSVSYRGPTLWDTILDKRDQEIEPYLLFKKKINSPVTRYY